LVFPVSKHRSLPHWQPLTLSIGGPIRDIKRDQVSLIALARELTAPLMAISNKR
jgi:hypothetical protein